jgi:hypothetical protein
MAIYSSVPPPEQQAAAEGITLAAQLWDLTVSPRETGVTLSIPLDKHVEDGDSRAAHKAHKEPMRRDSMKRREALLKGKEGSRRRQRWENGEYIIHHSCTINK